MKNTKDQINGEYLSTLISFLSGTGEAGLQRGYELGRRALDARLGVLQVAEAYVTAMSEILTPLSEESARTLASTRELLSTSLAPYEMTHRGYQESIAKLMKLNVALEQQAGELTAVNRELEAFSYTVSHDLRAPIRVMEGFAKILLEDYGKQLDEKGREYLSRVIDSARRMGQLVEGLLSLSRFSRQVLTRSSVELSQIARAIFQELRSTQPTRHVVVSIAENVTVQGDQQLLQVAMSNLLTNAWKFTAKKVDAKIEFGMSTQDGNPVYFVKDNGAGFDMKYADKLFGPFQRLHSATQFEGTGVGLATVRRIIERHEGRIWAEGKVNHGATFYFTL